MTYQPVQRNEGTRSQTGIQSTLYQSLPETSREVGILRCWTPRLSEDKRGTGLPVGHKV